MILLIIGRILMPLRKGSSRAKSEKKRTRAAIRSNIKELMKKYPRKKAVAMALSKAKKKARNPRAAAAANLRKKMKA